MISEELRAKLIEAIKRGMEHRRLNLKGEFMPHYKDGTLAQVGDYVRGTGYNIKDEKGEPRILIGRLVSITPNSESCNCIVAFVDEIAEPQVQSSDGKLRVTDAQGQPHFLYVRTDYGETKAFEKLT